jgi:uncharacterized pyridoxal phosphate-containing UPF0001 family protein
MSTESARQIAQNVQRVRAEVHEAARRSGRDPAEITTVAVTKYVQVAQVKALIEAGCRDLGESRPQQLWSKAEALQAVPETARAVRWHLVGHLQRNKANRTIPLVSLIHSVDSVRLLRCIDELSAVRPASRQAADENSPFSGREPTDREAAGGQAGGPVPSAPAATPILLEVNVSGDAAKHGFAPDDIEPLLVTMPDYPHVSLRGLMAMAGLEGGREGARRDFERLRQLRDRLQASCPPGTSLDELSMGMSRDFDLAIAEGATIVRIGSAYFEGLDL